MPPSLSNTRRKWPTPCEKRRLWQISAHNGSTVEDSEKSSIMTNTPSQKLCKFVLSKLHHIYTNFDNILQKDGTEAKIMQDAFILRLN